MEINLHRLKHNFRGKSSGMFALSSVRHLLNGGAVQSSDFHAKEAGVSQIFLIDNTYEGALSIEVAIKGKGVFDNLRTTLVFYTRREYLDSVDGLTTSRTGTHDNSSLPLLPLNWVVI